MRTTLVLNDEMTEKAQAVMHCAGEIHSGKRKGI
jgi:hypothetical protein